MIVSGCRRSPVGRVKLIIVRSMVIGCVVVPAPGVGVGDIEVVITLCLGDICGIALDDDQFGRVHIHDITPVVISVNDVVSAGNEAGPDVSCPASGWSAAGSGKRTSIGIAERVI